MTTNRRAKSVRAQRITPEEQQLHHDLVELLLERTDSDEQMLGQLVLAGIRIMAHHLDPNRAGEAFLEVVRQTVAELRH
ncbi:MAG: hypothetical protein EOO77_02330 [Oxalobacteraceae bacterium]|nr:MAG: hypothetical protein EOO77_02330 [Oxalobacteraceae bacterium]